MERQLAVLRETIKVPSQPARKSGGDPSDVWFDIDGETDPSALASQLTARGLPYYGGVSLVEAFQVAGVLACSDVIAQDISKATFRMKRRLANGGSVIVGPRDHPIAAMLALEPHPEYSWGEFFEMVVRWLVVTQQAYIVKGADREGGVTELIPLMTLRVLLFVDPTTGAKWYNVTRGSTFERALLRDYDLRIPEQNIIHIRARMVDGLYGYSSLVAGRAALILSRSINDYQARLYSTDGREKIAIQLPRDAEFNQEQWERLLLQWRQKWLRVRTENEPMLLEAGAVAAPISMTAADAEVAKVRDQQILEVARLWRVPPHKIMHFDNSKYSNLEAQEKVYLADTLIPPAKRIEDTMARALLRPKDRLKYFFEFDRDEMAAVDSKTRAEIAKEALERNAITIDEYRAKTGDDPLPNGAGKVRLLPVNFALLDENNKVVVQGATRAQVPEGSNEPAVPGIDAAPKPAGNAPKPGGNDQNTPKPGKNQSIFEEKRI